MSKQKVWIEKMPEYCDDCPCSLRDKDDCAYCNLLHKNIGYDFGKRPKHCPLQLIKTHDRELVKEVCEKIKNNVNDMPYYDDRTGYVSPTDVCEMIDELQKEFEK